MNDLDGGDSDLAPVELRELHNARDQWGDAYLREVLGLVASARYARRILPGKKTGVRLTPELVREIREVANTKDVAWIASHYGIEKPAVRALLHGRTWDQVK